MLYDTKDKAFLELQKDGLMPDVVYRISTYTEEVYTPNYDNVYNALMRKGSWQDVHGNITITEFNRKP